MRKFRFLLLVFLFFTKATSLSAQEEEGVLSPPPPIFAHKEIASFLPQIPKVNIITGEYHEEELDFVVAGSEPLSIRRFYSHLGHKNQAYGHWNINPEALMLFNFRSDHDKPFAGIGEENGNFILCEKKQGEFFVFDPDKHKNFTNTGKCHPLNVRFSYNKVTPGHYENYWEGVIEDGLGGKKLYRSEIGMWERYVYTEPVYQAWIKEERKPNGNIFYYDYEDFNHKFKTNSNYKNLSTYYILRSISAYSSKGVFLGSIHLNYSDKVKDRKKEGRRYIEAVNITGSDGRIATIHNRIREVQRKKTVRNWGKSYERPEILDVVLDHIEAPSKPTQSYNYRWEKAKTYFDHPYMIHAEQSEGRVLETTYDLGSKKVTEQKAPVGSNGEMCPIARYEYQNDHTVVYDGENHKTLYRFNDDKRITAIEKYDEDQLVQIERSEWNGSNGNLTKKQIEDDAGNILHIIEYEYDKNHNVVKERVGDGKSTDTIRRTFSDDGFNLKLTESDRPGKLIRYSYIPDTNLISSEITYEHDHIVKRIFHFYDDEIPSVRVKTIIDDGHSENSSDLTQISYRKILEIQPKREVPCVGLPEEVQSNKELLIEQPLLTLWKGNGPLPKLSSCQFRKIKRNFGGLSPIQHLPNLKIMAGVFLASFEIKTIDNSGNEILLKKVRYTYHPSGKVEREDHYDTNDVHRYCILNEYDEKERLIATIDALGSRSTFTYDANFNLTSQDGPRSDINKEWSYDKVNRPIQEREWQTDGTLLISEKKYDKCCRLISQTDPCGFETRYEYSALGQITAIIYPDDAIERKEYDALGNVIKEIDANGFITLKEYNFRSQPTAITHSDGREEHFIYNTDGGTLATHIDPNGTKTVYFYDLFDNPIKKEIYSPEGDLLSTTSATFSPFHKLSETDAEGTTTHYTYDYAGRMVAKQIGEQIISYAYDELGRLTHTQEGNVVTTNTYDVKGQLIEKSIDDLDHQKYFQETYTYDEAGNRTSVITCSGASQTVYNSRGEPIQKIDPLGNTTDITYSYGDCYTKTTTNPKGIQTLEIHDARGRLVDLQVKNISGEIIQRREKRYDPAGNQTHSTEHVFEGPTLRETITHEWVYGPDGRIDKVVEAGEKTTQYCYDKAGRLKITTKPDGAEIHREYDALNRLSRYYGIGIDYVYKYDRKDRLLEVEDKELKTTTKRAYDLYGNVIEETLASGLTIRSRYDPYGRRTALYLPDGSEASFTNRGPYLYSVSRKGYTHTYSERNLAGKPTLIILPNNSGTISITWDPLLRWEKLHSPYYQATCSYDSVGNLTGYSYTDPLGSENNHYKYDDLNQLTSENGHDYRYDSLYNRTAKDGSTYSLNPLCQVTHDGQKEYTYDTNGNLISDGETTYEYDLLDRLISTTKGKTRTTYTYDAFNRRIAKNGAFYIWDGKKEIGMSRGGKVRELRILGEGLGAEIGSSVIFEIGGYTYFPIHDIQGSLATLVYTNKKLYDTLRYTAFGEQLTKAYYSPWRFAGKRYDDESKLIYFGRRYYSPSLGRWITADPQGFDDGPNLYAYVRNSPLLAIDLYGLEGRNGAWANYRGSWRATWDYCYDGFCHVGPWIGSRMKTGYEMQWSLISNPMGHVRRLWNDVYDFAKQAPQEMNVASFKRGCAEAGKSLFPKSAQAIHSLSDNTLDDYTRAYRNQQASLEVVSYCAVFLAGALEFSTFGKASRLAEEVVSAEEFLISKKNSTKLYRAISELEFKQIQKSGKFGIGPNSLEGKFFAESVKDAESWGSILNGLNNSRIIEIELPYESASKLKRWDRLDGIGPARYGTLDQLLEAIIKEVK